MSLAASRDIRTLAHFIAGRFVPPVAGTYVEDVAPATGAVIARLPRGDAADVGAAVEAARGAIDHGWRRSSTAERAELCEAIAARIEHRLDELAALESHDTGKPLALARRVDIPRAVANFRFFAGAVRHHATEMHEMQGAINYTLRRPLGVVGLITPWNLPLYLLTWKCAPALAMGNSVVAKPSELTPLTAAALAEIFLEAGAPAGVFNLVHGLGAEAGAALVEHADVAAVSFTGGTATGARVAAAAAPLFKKLSLELGGKNPTLVFADCDFEAAVEGSLLAGFLNQGQVCLCGSRILVERAIHDRFVDALVERVRAMRVGDPADEATCLGALVGLEHRDKVERYLQLARDDGGQVHGGARPDLPPPFDRGAFLQPAVVTGLPHSCRFVQEEIFGPVVSVHPFDDEEEAVTLANDVRYGLSASLWTRDLERAHRVSARLETGMVWVNTWLLRDLRVPFGGAKQSGVGREGGRWSLEFFSEARNVCIQLENKKP
ncbi:MAG: aldehyde dehydrogenase [Candidatus Latescibacterota bacterium]|nr:MAG: aldehyde dehydrogenase [Candidatus Latescibacterota bacterium]